MSEPLPNHCWSMVDLLPDSYKIYKHEQDYWPWLGMISANFWMYRTGNNLWRVGIQVVAYYYYNALCLRGPWSNGHGESLSPDLKKWIPQRTARGPLPCTFSTCTGRGRPEIPWMPLKSVDSNSSYLTEFAYL